MGAPASVSAFRVNEALSEYFTVYDSAGATVTGLVNANFTKWLAANNATSAQTVTVNEVDAVNNAGLYRVTFTPNAAGHWTLRVNHATYNLEGWLATWIVFASDLGDIDFIATTAIPAAPTADTLNDKVNFLEERAGEGWRTDWAYDGSNRVSSVALTYSQDGFATTHRSRTATYTYGDAANPLRPTRIQWTT